MKTIESMAKAAYPKIMYCEDAYKRGANEALDEMKNRLLRKMPPYYARMVEQETDKLKGGTP